MEEPHIPHLRDSDQCLQRLHDPITVLLLQLTLPLQITREHLHGRGFNPLTRNCGDIASISTQTS